MGVHRKTLRGLQMAVPYFSANCISAECTGEDILQEGSQCVYVMLSYYRLFNSCGFLQNDR